MKSEPTIDPKQPTLVSFSLCPFVQRSVIAMNAKGEDFRRLNIDLSAKPDWFLSRVPTGKVPALLIDGEVVFESAVISEFVDESYGAPLLSRVPLERARERAWISFAGTVLGQQFSLLSATTEEDFTSRKEVFLESLLRLGAETRGGFFNGETLALIDTAVAPIFTRLVLTPRLHAEVIERAKDSQLAKWIDTLVGLPEVVTSVAPNFADEFREFFGQRNSYVLERGRAV